MKKYVMLAAAVSLAFAASACATKRYPMATALSDAEYSILDCRELQIEYVRGLEIQRTISDTASIDWRSAAAFATDFGIGNAMAKNDAERAVDARLADLASAATQKGCYASGEMAHNGDVRYIRDGQVLAEPVAFRY